MIAVVGRCIRCGQMVLRLSEGDDGGTDWQSFPCPHGLHDLGSQIAEEVFRAVKRRARGESRRIEERYGVVFAFEEVEE